MITVTVNGAQRQLKGPTKLNNLLQDLGVRITFMAVAHNGRVLERSEYGQITLQEGDSLELVRPVGGGTAINRGGIVAQ